MEKPQRDQLLNLMIRFSCQVKSLHIIDLLNYNL